MNTQLQQVVDHREVTDLVYRLGVCLDEGGFEEMRSLFVDEVTAHTTGGTAVGLEAVVAQARRNHRPENSIQHVTTNLLVDLADDAGKVRANLMVHFATRAEGPTASLAPPIRFALGEVYHFDVVRTPGGWRFSRVETVPVWMSGTPDRVPQPA